MQLQGTKMIRIQLPLTNNQHPVCGKPRGTKRKGQEVTTSDAKATKSIDTTADENQKQKTPAARGIRSVTSNTQKVTPTAVTEEAKGKGIDESVPQRKSNRLSGEDKKITKTVKIKMKGKQQAIPDYNSDSDFEEHHILNEMGLGSLLDMTVDGIPSKLGFFVVNNLDTNSMQLRLQDGSIVINETTVHEIMKVPLGGLNLHTMEQTAEGQELATLWKQQYAKESPRPTDVMNTIQSSTDAGLMFKLNFIVLFVNSMAECSRMGCCSVNFLHRLRNIESISTINWCGYIFECLKRSKHRWRNNTYDSFYAGPLTFLTLLYAENTTWENEDLDSSALPLQKWSMELLRTRQTDAIKQGGFHMATIRRPGQTSNHTHANTSTEPQSNPMDEESEADLKKEFIMELNEKFSLLMRTKVDAQTVIMEAKEKFPNDSIFESQTTYGLIDAQILEKSVGKLPSDESKGTAACKPPSCVADHASNSTGTNLQIVPVNETEEQAVPISQCGPDIPIPSFNLGISPPKPHEAQPSRKGKEAIRGKEEHMRPPRRQPKLSEKMRSLTTNGILVDVFI
ncbi:hypothetical protein L6452_01379 [Arctium lappa]|uniref:Uncharacterized protein n=1 Tax=Arctium lappa TaxID=4217 RepID=A0ACB9FGH2_ARCLA|nr:hypothetical protein L6452_01379 [Arctium lappa]